MVNSAVKWSRDYYITDVEYDLENRTIVGYEYAWHDICGSGGCGPTCSDLDDALGLGSIECNSYCGNCITSDWVTVTYSDGLHTCIRLT